MSQQPKLLVIPTPERTREAEESRFSIGQAKILNFNS
jgi:hypothetical protein